MRSASSLWQSAFGGLVALAAVVISGCGQVDGTRQKPPSPAAADLPVTVQVVDGAGYRQLLKKHVGKVVFVDFWATW